jgi:hemerythrin superfamily protein
MPNRMDDMMSKGAGVAKAVKATFQGLTGVFRVLEEEHGEVGTMLKRVQKDPSKRGELWPKIRSELLSHERAELREIYPVLRAYIETRTFADQHDSEAGTLEAQIKQVDAQMIDAPGWGVEFDRLCQLVFEHVELEEGTIFKKAQDVLGKDKAKELESRFLSTKKSLMS